MFGLLLSVSLVIWIIAVCVVFSKGQLVWLRFTAEYVVNGTAFLLLVLTLYLLYLAHKNNEDLYGNFATSLGSIAITVILIDRLNAWRLLEQRKQEVFEELESRVRDVAVEAVRLARKYGWLDEALKEVSLQEAQLEGANLEGANLEGANLEGANLKGATLWVAKLEGAYLWGANLKGTNLLHAHLEGVFYDKYTIWPEGFSPQAAGAILRSRL